MNIKNPNKKKVFVNKKESTMTETTIYYNDNGKDQVTVIDHSLTGVLVNAELDMFFYGDVLAAYKTTKKNEIKFTNNFELLNNYNQLISNLLFYIILVINALVLPLFSDGPLGIIIFPFVVMALFLSSLMLFEKSNNKKEESILKLDSINYKKIFLWVSIFFSFVTFCMLLRVYYIAYKDFFHNPFAFFAIWSIDLSAIKIRMDFVNIYESYIGFFFTVTQTIILTILIHHEFSIHKRTVNIYKKEKIKITKNLV